MPIDAIVCIGLSLIVPTAPHTLVASYDSQLIEQSPSQSQLVALKLR